MMQQQHYRITALALLLFISTSSAFTTIDASRSSSTTTALNGWGMGGVGYPSRFLQTQRIKRAIARTKRRRSSELNVGAVYSDENTSNNLEGGIFWMTRATNCANSEICDLEEAQTCLDHVSQIDMVHLAAEKATAVKEVVANLRQKIDTESNIMTNTDSMVETPALSPYQMVMTGMNLMAGVYMICALVSDTNAVEGLSLDADTVFSCFNACANL